MEEDARSTHGQTDLLIAELQDRVRSLEETNRENRRIIAVLTQRIPQLEAPQEAPEPRPGPPPYRGQRRRSGGRREPVLVAADLRGRVAFLYESPFLDLEVYRLLTILEASSALAEFKGTYATDQNRVRFIRGLEYPEISRIVVSLAAIIRSATDANRDSDLELERPVGVILPDTTRPRAWQSLEFREACNKILHADLVELERKPETDALTGELFLEGRYRGKDWHARLDLRQYALAALALTP